MSETVVPFSKVGDEIHTDTVNLLRDVLAKAEAGEIIAVAIIAVEKARTVATAWSQSDQYHLLNSGAARLAHRLAGDAGETWL